MAGYHTKLLQACFPPKISLSLVVLNLRAAIQLSVQDVTPVSTLTCLQVLVWCARNVPTGVASHGAQPLPLRSAVWHLSGESLNGRPSVWYILCGQPMSAPLPGRKRSNAPHCISVHAPACRSHDLVHLLNTIWDAMRPVPCMLCVSVVPGRLAAHSYGFHGFKVSVVLFSLFSNPHGLLSRWAFDPVLL